MFSLYRVSLTLVKNSFRKQYFMRDIIGVLVISILCTTVAARLVSQSTDRYFQQTVSSLVGEYGEHDLIIQVREDMKEEADAALLAVIAEQFPGATMKNGPSLSGKTSFFIALPEAYKTAEVYQNLNRFFASVPGGAGVGVLTEPRVTIRGVPEGAKAMVMQRLSEIPGVKFTFPDGAAVGVLLTNFEQAPAATAAIKSMLKEYQVLEVTFPVGAEPSNPVHSADALAAALRREHPAAYVKNVAVDGKNEDMTYMVSTMLELRRFLNAYASQVVVRTTDGTKLQTGEQIVLAVPAGVTAGATIPADALWGEVKNLRPDGSADMRIFKGDAGALTSAQGYKVENGHIGTTAVTATLQNPRQTLGTALKQTAGVVSDMPAWQQQVGGMSRLANTSLSQYEQGLAALEQTVGGLRSADSSLAAVGAQLARIDTSALNRQLKSSSQAMGNTLASLQVLRWVGGDGQAALDSLTNAQQNVSRLQDSLATIDSLANSQGQIRQTVAAIAERGEQSLGALRSFDSRTAQGSLKQLDQQLAKLSSFDADNTALQISYLAAAVPQLTDEEINKSVRLLDQFIAGQVIPGARLQLLVNQAVTLEMARPLVYQEIGHQQASVYMTDIGVIEPDARGELYRVLQEVRGLLAALTAVVCTLALLVFDHAAIMAALLWRSRKRQNGTLKPWQRWGQCLAAPHRLYGCILGFCLLGSTFYLAKGSVPYLPGSIVPLLGAVAGWCIAGLAERISPVDGNELMAGEALGLSFTTMLRELVIPNARPGLLQWLNRRQQQFR